MSHGVATFILTIFDVSKESETITDAVIQIEISESEHEQCIFNLSEIVLPQSCCFDCNCDVLNINININLNISNKYCFEIVIPLKLKDKLYFHDKIMNEVMMRSTNKYNIIPPIISLSITPTIPLPLIIGMNHASIYYRNNNIAPPILELDLRFDSKMNSFLDLLDQFIDNCDSSNVLNEINKNLKNRDLRHMILIALFYKLDKLKSGNAKYIATYSMYKILYQILQKTLNYAHVHPMDIKSFYLVLCIARVTFYRNEHHINCLLDDLRTEEWINKNNNGISAVYQWMHYLLQNKTNYFSCLQIILCFILIHKTENRFITNKFEQLYSKINLIDEIITKLPTYLPLNDDKYENMRNHLFVWLIKPICSNLLLKNHTDENKNISSILCNYKNTNKRKVFTHLDGSYYSLLSKYYHILLAKKKQKKACSEFKIAATETSAETQSEPILKHYISNYAIIPSMDTNIDMEINMEIKMKNGEKELEKLLHFNDGIAILIAGVPIVPGIITITNYRLIFVPYDHRYKNDEHFKHYFDVAFGSIFNILQQTLSASDPINVLQQQIINKYCHDIDIKCYYYKFQLQIMTKDCRDIKLLFGNISQSNLNKFIAQLRHNAFSNDIEKTFAVECGVNNDNLHNGWNVYSFFDEFARQKVEWKKWRITKINIDYKYSASYPSHFIVPSTISDTDLDSIKSFRSKSRIPVLTYYHAANDSVILRSAQPMIGMAGLGGYVSTSWWSQNRCVCDEKLLFDASIKYIIDARPKMNAVVNQATGGGYENTIDFYKGIRLIFGNIQNIHEVRKSFDLLIKTINESIAKQNDLLGLLFVDRNININTYEKEEKANEDDADDQNIYNLILRDDYFWNSISSSLWFTYLRNIIACAICIVSMIDRENKSVLVHCSDGWDRTAQLCSLAQILLHPYYRTIRGLACLIEKEWLSFGHKYHERFGQTKDDITNDQRSPIFIQFLDCLQQIVSQYSQHFEFNIDLLSYIAANTTSCLYGTFLTNSEKERIEKYKLHQRTESIWTQLLNDDFLDQHKFKNVDFKTMAQTQDVLYIDHRSMSYTLWNYYTKLNAFPLNPLQNTQNIEKTPLHFTKNEIKSKQKDLEIQYLKSKNKELEKIESQFKNIMKCIDTNNGFLLQNQIPIMPNLDYFSSPKH